MDEDAIVATRLTRYFGNKAAVEDVDLRVPYGSVFAFLGRNGSGKTTTIRLLLGLLRPTRGHATVLGRDCERLTPDVRSRIGYLAEGHFVYGWMRVRECAKFQSSCFPRWNRKLFDGVVDYFGIDREARARNLSRGERAGLCLALALAPEPELLVLDDPALGLDPVARRSLVEALLAVTRRGDRTVFLSSHLLDDVERVADFIAILDNGVLRVHSSVEEFQANIGCWALRFAAPPLRLPEIPGLVHSRVVENEVSVTIANPGEAIERALAELGAESVRRVPLSLEAAVIEYLHRRREAVSLARAVGGDA